jgi:hypothetical protein
VLSGVSLAAIWLALGEGRSMDRLLLYTLVAIAAGSGLCWLDETIVYRSVTPIVSYKLTNTGWWWVAWTSLAGSFLTGMLLVLRATGYRLIRRRR